MLLPWCRRGIVMVLRCFLFVIIMVYSIDIVFVMLLPWCRHGRVSILFCHWVSEASPPPHMCLIEIGISNIHIHVYV